MADLQENTTEWEYSCHRHDSTRHRSMNNQTQLSHGAQSTISSTIAHTTIFRLMPKSAILATNDCARSKLRAATSRYTIKGLEDRGVPHDSLIWHEHERQSRLKDS